MGVRDGDGVGEVGAGRWALHDRAKSWVLLETDAVFQGSHFQFRVQNRPHRWLLGTGLQSFRYFPESSLIWGRG